MGYKNRLKRRRAEDFPYPPIPRSDQDIFDGPRSGHRRREVLHTDSTAWGTGEAARFRALNTTHVDRENERLVRTHHPALSGAPDVLVAESVFGGPLWLLRTPTAGIEAGGRPIHFWPANHYEFLPMVVLTPRSPWIYDDRFGRFINPRRFLTAVDLDSFREIFPKAVGLEVLVVGYVVVLFARLSDVKAAYKKEWPLEIAGLRVVFDVPRYECATAPSELGVGLSAGPVDERIPVHGCSGLKLKLPDGTEAITTITHGFVKVPSSSKCSQVSKRFRENYERIKLELARLRQALVNKRNPSPVGKEVGLASSNKKIGTITRTYDRPSALHPYPTGYLHDLSLITDENLPDVAGPQGYPAVTGWADYHAALEQGEVYVVCQPVCSQGSPRLVESPPLIKKATVLGTGYAWDRQAGTQNAFLLWHTGDGELPSDNLAGAPLCLGRSSDATSKAIVFENFQRQLPTSTWFPNSKSNYSTLVKGGFVLPAEIRDSVILGPEEKFNGHEN